MKGKNRNSGYEDEKNIDAESQQVTNVNTQGNGDLRLTLVVNYSRFKGA